MKFSRRRSRHKKPKNKILQIAIWVFGTILAICILWVGLGFVYTDTEFIPCVDPQEISAETKVYKTNPSAVVVEPWLGEHHVYALFVLPKKYLANFGNFQVVVKVRGSDDSIGATVANPAIYKSVEIPEGYFLVVSYFWTRQTLGLVLQGKFSELQYPCSWTLYIK
jgi:hypothetical protein